MLAPYWPSTLSRLNQSKYPLYLHCGEKALEVLPVQLAVNGAAAALRWKSQRIKIQGLAYRFSIDFKIHTLAYGFFIGNHKDLGKSLETFV